MTDDLWRRAREIEKQNAERVAAEKARDEAKAAELSQARELQQQQLALIEVDVRRQLIEVGAFAAQYFPSRGIPPTEFRDAAIARVPRQDVGPLEDPWEKVYNYRQVRGSGWEIYGAYIAPDGSWWRKKENNSSLTWQCRTVETVIKSLANTKITELNRIWSLVLRVNISRTDASLLIVSDGRFGGRQERPFQETIVQSIVAICDSTGQPVPPR